MEWQEQLNRLYGSPGEDIHAGDPRHMDWLAEHSPRAEAEWRTMFIPRGVDFASRALVRDAQTHPLTKAFGAERCVCQPGLQAYLRLWSRARCCQRRSVTQTPMVRCNFTSNAARTA